QAFGDLIGLSLLAPNMPEGQRDELAALLERAAEVGRGGDAALLGDAGDETTRFTTGSGQLALVFVSMNGAREDSESVDPQGEAIEALRTHVREVRESSAEFASIEAGVTGVPVMESDEARQSMEDASMATMLALGVISVLMMLVYRGVVVPILAVLSLLLGMAWSFGWVTLAVGHLQLLSVVFAVMLLGLGIDIAIHLIARLELVHPDHDHMPQAVAQAFRGVGAGVVTGALTTAAAFGATALTDFSGMAEMGLIAAGGIALCTISVMTCFPAMLEALPHPERMLRSREGGEARPYMRGLLNGLNRRPWVFVGVWVGVLALGVWGASQVRYNPDLLSLMPADAESVVWEKRLEESDARSVWHAVVVAENEDEARELTRSLRAQSLVAQVGAAGMLFPADVAEKQAILEALPDPGAIAPGSGGGAEMQSVAARLAERWRGEDAALAEAADAVASLGAAGAARVNEAFVAEREALARRIGS
ncbi:MAG: MMPL family transporter, partial [Planctomycetota bacterium]|nr:MMPL family transporter [Planctomycetota bacterium]